MLALVSSLIVVWVVKVERIQVQIGTLFKDKVKLCKQILTIYDFFLNTKPEDHLNLQEVQHSNGEHSFRK